MSMICLLCCLFVFQDNSLPIFPVQNTPSAKTPENFKMTANGFLFLNNKKDTIQEYDYDGILVDEFHATKDTKVVWKFTHFCFVENVPGFRETGAIIYEISNGDRYVTKLRPCFRSSNERDAKERNVTIPNDWVVREFISDGSDLFINVRKEDEQDYYLVAVNIKLLNNKYKVQAVSDPFGSVDRIYSEWGDNFKHRWVVKDPNGNVFAAHELRSRLQKFSTHKSKMQVTDAPRFSLPNWINPFRLPGKEDWNWRFSFSHVTGLYHMGEGLLIGYTEPSEEDSHPFVLNLVYMDVNGNPLAEPKSIPGGRLMGVNSGQRTAYVYLYEGNDNNLKELYGPGVITNFEF